ncbi:MAG TPA: hypothetical protein VFO11_14255 [Candidatus Polarisedimenticolaceae bacterium]|nr:hypothetical protein [Candidatus Polarisedimenticolaceae bacterium]
MREGLEGIDDATRRLYREIVESPAQRAFLARMRALQTAADHSCPPADVTLAIVPGAFYREHPGTGADGRVVRAQAERAGWTTTLVPLASLGSLQENARLLVDWLLARRGSRLVLVSLSKGGSDIKAALVLPEAGAAFADVAGWINLCGILHGTPMADWLLSSSPAAVLNRLYHRLRGRRLDFLHDLRRGAGLPLDGALRLPSHLRMISVIGFPLREHLSNGLARRCHRRLAPLGPNDGCVILADYGPLPGWIYPLWGADHYLRSGADVGALTVALLRCMADELRVPEPVP